MLLGDSVEGGEYQWQDDLTVLLYQTEDVLVIPEIKSPLRYLGDSAHTQKIRWECRCGLLNGKQ